MGDPDVDGRII